MCMPMTCFPPHVAVYRPHCENQKREMERIQEEESLTLPPDIDYLSLPVSLSNEVREILDRVRPDTVSVHTFLIIIIYTGLSPPLLYL